MIHLMLGSSFEKAICKVMGYVQSYEDEGLADFFTGMIGTLDAGEMIFRTTQRFAVDNGKSLQFNSEPENPFDVMISEEDKTVIGVERQQEYLKNFFSRLFDKRVTINRRNKDNVLNICIYLPMHDRSYWEMARKCIEAITSQTRNIKVDLFFFAPDLAFLFTPEESIDSLPEVMPNLTREGQVILKEAVDFKTNDPLARDLNHIVVMQNCNADGVSLDLDWNSFVRIVGEWAIATINSYKSIFHPNAELDDNRPIHSFGLCVLDLDKYYYVRYLLSRAYVTILEREGIDQELVDVNIPAQIIQDAFLAENNCYKFYDRFYEHRVRGYLADGRKPEEVNAQAMKDIDPDISKFIVHITSFMNDMSLSLPQKRVALAQLLGMDDAYMSGDVFNQNQIVFRDTYADCIEMFVAANNALLNKAPTDIDVYIPEKEVNEEDNGDYPESISLRSYSVLGDTQIDFKRLRQDLKDSETKIRRQTEYIRLLEKEVADCDVQVSQSERKDKVLTKDGFKYGDTIYKIEHIETIPLEKTYEPSGKKLAKSIDLRKSFSPVRNQGSVGSCSAFTMTGIYEYILNSGQSKSNDLSERFLYYNSRIAKLKREGTYDESKEPELKNEGVSFFDAITSLQNEGICLETLWEYTTDEAAVNTRPSAAAYEDAKVRLVTEAKNVALEEDHIKSALNEGYPVAAILKVYSSFADPICGFVEIPDPNEVKEAEKEDINPYHAVIICGYSDEDKVFIVRNSWGHEYGDKGYCYVPYSYVSDKDLCVQACIITGVSVCSDEELRKQTRAHEVVSFDKMNPQINAAIIRNLLSEARRDMNALVDVRNMAYSAYALIEKKLVSSEARASLTEGTKERLDYEIKYIERQQAENYKAQDKRLDALAKENKTVNITFGVSLLVLIVNAFILYSTPLSQYIVTHIPYMKIFYWVLLLGIIAMGIWWYKYFSNRKEIKEEHADINRCLEEKKGQRVHGGGESLGLYRDTLEIRMFMPWLVVRKLSEKNRILEQQYQTMVNFTENLKEWYRLEKENVRTMDPNARVPFISLLSNSTLDKFYEKHADAITSKLSLSSMFMQGYALDDESIVRFQNQLKNTIIKTLEDSLKGFSVYKYITGQTSFEFANERDFEVNTMLSSLEDKSEIYVRIGAAPVTYESMNATTIALMSSDIGDDLPTWEREFQKNFTTSLSHIRIASDFKLAFIKIKALTVQECCDLYDPEVWTAKEEEEEKVEVVTEETETQAETEETETDPVVETEETAEVEVAEEAEVVEETVTETEETVTEEDAVEETVEEPAETEETETDPVVETEETAEVEVAEETEVVEDTVTETEDTVTEEDAVEETVEEPGEVEETVAVEDAIETDEEKKEE